MKFNVNIYLNKTKNNKFTNFNKVIFTMASFGDFVHFWDTRTNLVDNKSKKTISELT